MITVLLAAWNGEKFIREQMDSILRQKGPELRIFVSDDGSTDGTGEILNEYQAEYPDQVFLYHRSSKRRERDTASGIPAAAGNFFWLMQCAAEDSEYVMLSDQDDVWKDHKAQTLLDEMKRLEEIFGTEHPILVHSDMEVADVNLKTIHKSFFAYQNCNPNRVAFSELLVENAVTGGAVMMNRALLELVKERPAACFMHDWWIALAASCFGTISCVREPLYWYRQHGHNTLGAQKAGNVKAVRNRFRQMLKKESGKMNEAEKIETNYRKMSAQAHAFGTMFQDRMTEQQKATLRAYLALRYQSPMGRLKNIMKNRFFKSSRIQTLAQCVTIPRPDGGNWPI